MARSITSGFQTEIEAQGLNPRLFIKAEFDSGALRLWSGLGNITFNSEVYTGAGDLLDVSAVEESQELRANTVVFSLDGLDSAVVSLALTENYQGRKITMWFAVLDNNGAIIADPYKLFSGQMDVMEITDDGDKAILKMSAESDLIDLRDAKERRYTHEDQQLYYPGDLGLEFVSKINDIELSWGAGVE